jgi:hypothetical protein
MPIRRTLAVLGCSLAGASAIALAMPATASAGCLLGIPNVVCDNGILTAPGSTGVLNTSPGSLGIANLGGPSWGVANIGGFNAGAANIGGFNAGAANIGTGHTGLLGIG